TFLYFGKTMSGFPGSFLSCSLYLIPFEKRNFLTSISGLVSLPLIWLMLKLLISFECTSAIIIHRLLLVLKVLSRPHPALLLFFAIPQYLVAHCYYSSLSQPRNSFLFFRQARSEFFPVPLKPLLFCSPLVYQALTFFYKAS